MHYRLFRVLLPLAMLLIALAGWAEALPTQDEALPRGVAFVKAVGWVKAGDDVSSFLIPSNGADKWGVKVVLHTPSGDEGIPLVLDKASGQVLCATHNGALKRLSNSTGTLTSAQAETAAVTVLQAAELPTEQWKVDASKLERQSAGNRWSISFRRVYGGYPFQYDRVNIALDPRDGTLLTLVWENRSPLPESLEASTSRGAAEQTARMRLTAEKFTITRVDSAQLMFVKVKDYSSAAKPDRSRLAWVVRCVWVRPFTTSGAVRHSRGHRPPARRLSPSSPP